MKPNYQSKPAKRRRMLAIIVVTEVSKTASNHGDAEPAIANVGARIKAAVSRR